MAKSTKSLDENEKKENETNVNDDIQTKRELYQAEQKLEKLEEQNKLLQDEIKEAKSKVKVGSAPNSDDLVALRAQVEMLSKQVLTGQRTPEGRLVFRQPTGDDVVPEGKEVTFIARNVFYVVGSYKDHRGIEMYPPHKIIVFNYASSDIRKEGRESQIINFSTYTTNLKTEIDFLRKSPYYGIAFSESTNEMAAEDIFETQYKIQAASQLSGMAPETIYARAEQYKIPNWRSKSAEQLRFMIVHEMAKDFRRQNEELQKELAKKRELAITASTGNKENEE